MSQLNQISSSPGLNTSETERLYFSWPFNIQTSNCGVVNSTTYHLNGRPSDLNCSSIKQNFIQLQNSHLFALQLTLVYVYVLPLYRNRGCPAG